MIELDNFNFDEEVAKFNDVIFNDHKTVLKDIESKLTSSHHLRIR